MLKGARSQVKRQDLDQQWQQQHPAGAAAKIASDGLPPSPNQSAARGSLCRSSAVTTSPRAIRVSSTPQLARLPEYLRQRVGRLLKRRTRSLQGNIERRMSFEMAEIGAGVFKQERRRARFGRFDDCRIDRSLPGRRDEGFGARPEASAGRGGPRRATCSTTSGRVVIGSRARSLVIGRGLQKPALVQRAAIVAGQRQRLRLLRAAPPRQTDSALGCSSSAWSVQTGQQLHEEGLQGGEARGVRFRSKRPDPAEGARYVRL